MGIDAAARWAAADRTVIDAIAAARRGSTRPILIGLAGAQGAGKSTMSARLASELSRHGMPATVLSLDDFYLPRAARAELARTVHPLLATRGVPGTHDIALLDATLTALLSGKPAPVPRFDKLRDDTLPSAQWPLAEPADVIILEGWCIGARPQTAPALAEPVNALERSEDPSGTWRRWINARLTSDYAALFARLDQRVFLRAPGFEVVAKWRGEQEAGLVRGGGGPGMNATALARFIAHYERLTRWMIADAPADLVIDLDAERVPVAPAA